MSKFYAFVLVAAIDVAIIGCTAHYVRFCLLKELHSDRRAGYPYPLDGANKLKRYAYFVIVFVGFFIVIYGTTNTLLNWPPDTTYGSQNDQFFRNELAYLVGLIGAPLVFVGLHQVSKKLDELEALRLEKASRESAEWRKTDDAKNWVEMDDNGELVEVKNLHLERFQSRTWKSCYEPPGSAPD